MASKTTKVELTKETGKWWVKVTFDNGTEWYPALIALGQILSGIGKAEDKKYPNGEGHAMTKRFIDSCWGKTRDEVHTMYYEMFDPKGTDAARKGLCALCKKRPHIEGSIHCEVCSSIDKVFDHVS